MHLLLAWGPAPWLGALFLIIVFGGFWEAVAYIDAKGECYTWAKTMVAEAVGKRPEPGAHREELPAFDPWGRALMLDLWVGQSSVHARVASAGRNGKMGDWDDVGASHVFTNTAKGGEDDAK